MKQWVVVFIALIMATGSQAAPVYIELAPEFVVNYGDNGRLKYMKAQVTIRAVDDEAALEVNYHSDYLRHELIMLFSRQLPSIINSPEGKEAMLKEATKAVQRIMRNETGRPMIDQVLFTNFVAP